MKRHRILDFNSCRTKNPFGGDFSSQRDLVACVYLGGLLISLLLVSIAYYAPHLVVLPLPPAYWKADETNEPEQKLQRRQVPIRP